ncbi:hypothetical protein LTR95_012216 [Oleoguttula sp. CCFEE 5521]
MTRTKRPGGSKKRKSDATDERAAKRPNNTSEPIQDAAVAPTPPPEITAPKPTPVKSPTQPPPDLTAADKAHLKAYLDRTERPFAVLAIPASKKRKRSSASHQLLQDDLYDPRLTLQYEIKPFDKWSSLRKYKKFSVGSESIGCGECVLVKHTDETTGPIDYDAQWKARVLEIRALDQEHVYLRVAWLNRPEDLDIGRKRYHGKLELIPSNQLDIIDAMAVNGRIEVMHWDELVDDDVKAMPEEDQYFWRYTYDFVHTKSFSKLREICVCKTPQNPDELIVSCENKDCGQWMHTKCIAEAAVKPPTTNGNVKTPQKGVKAKKRASKVTTPTFSPDSRAVAIASSGDGEMTAEVFIKGQPKGPDVEASEKDEIVITDAAAARRTEKVLCLFCQSPLG